MRDYRKLKVYPKAHALVLLVYEATRDFPASELFALTKQMRACAASIPANILEGCGRKTNRDFARFIDFATGSGNELRYFAILTRDLKYLSEDVAADIYRRATEVIRMLVALARGARRMSKRYASRQPPEMSRARPSLSNAKPP